LSLYFYLINVFRNFDFFQIEFSSDCFSKKKFERKKKRQKILMKKNKKKHFDKLKMWIMTGFKTILMKPRTSSGRSKGDFFRTSLVNKFFKRTFAMSKKSNIIGLPKFRRGKKVKNGRFSPIGRNMGPIFWEFHLWVLGGASVKK